MVFKNLCALVLWTKEASAMEGLNGLMQTDVAGLPLPDICWLACIVVRLLKENSTMNKTEAQLVSYGILYLNPSSHQCQPSYKKYIAVLAATLLLMTNSCTNSPVRGY